MMDSVTGVLLGPVFQDLYVAIKRYMRPSLTRASTLRSKLGLLAEKVEPLSRRYDAIDARYPEAGAHREAQKLREILKKANALVRDCGGLRWWNLRRKRRISKRLSELTASFEILLSVDFGPAALMGRPIAVQGELREANLDRLLTALAEVVERNWKLDRMYVGRQVAPATLSAGGGGMRVEIHYEMTERGSCLSISACCGGHHGYDGEGGYFDRRGDYNSKWE